MIKRRHYGAEVHQNCYRLLSRGSEVGTYTCCPVNEEVSHLCRLFQVVQVTEKQLFSRNAWQDWHLPAEVLVSIPHSTYLKSYISSSCGGRQGCNNKELIFFKTQTHGKEFISQQDGSACCWRGKARPECLSHHLPGKHSTMQEATKFCGDRMREAGMNETLVPGDQDL